jgi:hypothetical protein
MEHKITAVSKRPPKTWTSKYGPMETYLVRLDGNDEAIEINRKPGNVPQEGEELYGTIEETDFGKRFKPAKKPFNQDYKGQVRDDATVKAQFAIKAAINYLPAQAPMTDVEATARTFFDMVDRIKSPKADGDKGNTEKKVDEVYDVTDEPINLNDIPF